MSPFEISSQYGWSMIVRRWLGCWVDFIVLVGPLVALFELLGEKGFIRAGVVWVPILVLYFPVLEGLTGKSIGKVVTGTVVVDELGFRPGILRATIRTAFRLLEVNPLLAGGAPDGVVVLLFKSRQRLGDMAARTFVLKKSDLPLLVAADGPSTTKPG